MIIPLEFNGEYLNINVSHELWRATKWPDIFYFLQSKGWFPFIVVRILVGFLLDMVSFRVISSLASFCFKKKPAQVT